MSENKADISWLAGNIMLFIFFFPPQGFLVGWEQPLGLWKVRRGLPNIVPTLNDLLGYAWCRIRPRPSSGCTWFRSSRRGG